MKKLNMFLALSAAAVIIGAGTFAMAQEPKDERRPDDNSIKQSPDDMPQPPHIQRKQGCGEMPPPPMNMDRQKGPGGCGQMPTPPMNMEQQRGPHCGMDKGHGPGGMDPLAMLEMENPEKAKELRTLKDTKPEEFRKTLKAATDEIFEKQKKDREEFGKLLEQYKQNPSDDLKAQISSKVAAQFDKKMKMEEKMISQMEGDLKKTKEKLEKQQNMKDQLVDLKVSNIIFEQELRW